MDVASSPHKIDRKIHFQVENSLASKPACFSKVPFMNDISSLKSTFTFILTVIPYPFLTDLLCARV